MKTYLSILLIALLFQSCGNEPTNNSTSHPDTLQEMRIKAFNDVNTLVATLSENGIGTLKPWQNPMDLGYGSLTDYYPIGTSKVAYGLSNNLAYYLEGTETTAKNLLINLNINNPDEKKEGLATLKDLTSRTFKSLKLEVPKGLLSAVKLGKEFKADESDFVSNSTLEKSKTESWKVLIVSK